MIYDVEDARNYFPLSVKAGLRPGVNKSALVKQMQLTEEERIEEVKMLLRFYLGWTLT